ncbi:MAG TPA: EI24 domain-containing protein [Pseudolysinimonas sp.]|nr:EI24 domain-containing protein [Pseudolysinimonas sp.]
MARARAATGKPAGAVAEFFLGFATLFRGFGLWRRRPDLMLLGLLPAAIVGAGLTALLILILAGGDGFIGWATPFADDWDPALRGLFRIALALGLLAGFLVIAVFAFTALTLLVGDWFYERIWRAIEDQLGGFVPAEEPGFWRAAGDAVRLVFRAILTALTLALIGLIPVVGTAIAAVLGVLFAGRILALELTARPLEKRGMARRERLAVLRTRSPRVLGFGVATYLCFLVPLGAVVVMPAAVAGATVLVREALAQAEGTQAVAAPTG